MYCNRFQYRLYDYDEDSLLLDGTRIFISSSCLPTFYTLGQLGQTLGQLILTMIRWPLDMTGALKIGSYLVFCLYYLTPPPPPLHGGANSFRWWSCCQPCMMSPWNDQSPKIKIQFWILSQYPFHPPLFLDTKKKTKLTTRIYIFQPHAKEPPQKNYLLHLEMV